MCLVGCGRVVDRGDRSCVGLGLEKFLCAGLKNRLLVVEHSKLRTRNDLCGAAGLEELKDCIKVAEVGRKLQWMSHRR